NYTIGLGVPAGAFNVVTGFTDTGVARDPEAILGAPFDPDTTGADAGTPGAQDMSVAVSVGSLGPTQTVTFRYFLFLGTTQNQVSGLFNQVESSTGTGHLVADPKSALNDG